MAIWKTTLAQKKRLKLEKSQVKHFVVGLTKIKLGLLKLRREDINIINKTYSVIVVSLYLLMKRMVKKNKKYVIVELAPENNWTIWKDKNYILEKNTLIIELLQTSALELIGKEKDFKPFWDCLCEENSKRLWLPIETDYVDSVSNSFNGFYKKMEQNSQLLIEKNINQTPKNLQKTCFLSQQYIPANTWEEENIRIKKVKLKVNQAQKKIFEEWFHTCRKVYNIGVDEICKDSKNANFYNLRNEYVTAKRKGVKNPNIEEYMLNTPKDVRADTLKELVSNFKGNMTKLKNKQIKFFELKHKLKKFSCQVIPLAKNSIKILDKNRIQIYKTFTKTAFKFKEKNLKIEHDCKLEWRNKSIFYLLIPYKRKFIKYDNKKDIIALDPGIRKFVTGFSQNETIKIRFSNKINTLLKQIDNIKSKKGEKGKFRRATCKRYYKINNIVKECHYELINYLTKNYKQILLPEFNSQEFFGKKRILGKKNARYLNILSHYKFKLRLLHRCELTDTKLYIVDESYTSKTCTSCGVQNDVKSYEIYNCKECNIIIDRDINGSRNILLKHLG